MNNDYRGMTTLDGTDLADWLGMPAAGTLRSIPDGLRIERNDDTLEVEVLHPKRSLPFYFAGMTTCSFMVVLGVYLFLQQVLFGSSGQGMQALQWCVSGLGGQALMIWLAFEDWRTPQSLKLTAGVGRLVMQGSRLRTTIDLNGFTDVRRRPGGRLRLAGAAGCLTILKGLTSPEQQHLQAMLRDILAKGALPGSITGGLAGRS